MDLIGKSTSNAIQAILVNKVYILYKVIVNEEVEFSQGFSF